MGFRKYMKTENVQVVSKDESEEIRTIVKQAGVKSAADLTDQQRSKL